MTGFPGLRERSISALIWSFAQRWYAKAAALASLILLARLLDPADFGVVALASVFVGIFAAVSELGLITTLVRMKDLSARVTNTAFWTNLVVSIVLFLVIQVSAAPLAEVFGYAELQPILRALALSLPLSALSMVQVALLTRRLEMRALTVRHVIAISVGVGGAITIALAGGGVWALVFQSVAPPLFATVFLWVTVPWRPSLEFSFRDCRELLRTGIPVLGTGLVVQIKDRGTDFLIGAVLGAQVLGTWVVAMRLTRFVTELVSSSINAVTLATLSKMRDDPRRFETAVRYGVRVGAFITLPLLGALAMLSPLIVPVLFGAEWNESGVVAQLATIAALIGSIQLLDPSIWWVLGKARTELLLTCLQAALQLALIYSLSPYGLSAAASGLILAALASVPIRVVVLTRYSGLRLRIYADLPRIILSVTTMLVTVVVVLQITLSVDREIRLILATSGALLTYLLGSLVFQRTTLVEFTSTLRSAISRTRRRSGDFT